MTNDNKRSDIAKKLFDISIDTKDTRLPPPNYNDIYHIYADYILSEISKAKKRARVEVARKAIVDFTMKESVEISSVDDRIYIRQYFNKIIKENSDIKDKDMI